MRGHNERAKLAQQKQERRSKDMQDMTVEFGKTYRDKITGFEGIATGYCQYISGCSQVLIAPRVAPDGAMRESHWFDVQRVEVVWDDASAVNLDNSDTPGFDKAAPKR